jgi:hypothetical protein
MLQTHQPVAVLFGAEYSHAAHRLLHLSAVCVSSRSRHHQETHITQDASWLPCRRPADAGRPGAG